MIAAQGRTVYSGTRVCYRGGTMGTNYYARLSSDPCPTCGLDPHARLLHVGKSSAGWCFGLHVEPDDPDHPRDLDGWLALFAQQGVRLEDEYGEVVSPADLVNVITNRSALRPPGSGPPYGYSSWTEFYARNWAEPGPGGLIRHRVDGVHCVAHGSGPWDLIRGSFS